MGAAEKKAEAKGWEWWQMTFNPITQEIVEEGSLEFKTNLVYI